MVVMLLQVHRAQLKDGTPVAVKVQHQGIDAVFVRDIRQAISLAEVYQVVLELSLKVVF